MPTLQKNFDFLITKRWMLRCPSELPQYCNVEYKIDIFGSKKVFLSVSSIRLSPLQLNYLQWGPDVMGEMRQAAIVHYNDTRNMAEEPVFVDEEKI